MKANANIEDITVSAILIKKDGTKVDLGQIASLKEGTVEALHDEVVQRIIKELVYGSSID